MAKVAVQCSADSFVVNQSFVLRINICGKNRHLRQAADRYAIPIFIDTFYDKELEMELTRIKCPTRYLKMRLFILLAVLILCNLAILAQNSLHGVYITDRFVTDNDTINSFISGKVIDSLSHKPIVGATVEMYSSRGDALPAKSDETGHFKINQLPTGCSIRLICRADSIYKLKEWRFDTEGMSRIIQLNMILELSRK